MTGFGDIIGHEQIIEHFKSALKNHQVSHAYILNGENGSGKSMLAKAFAKALVCEAGYGDSCNMCRACHQFDSGNHPDVKWVTHEKANSIGVDDVREQINNDIVIKPYSSKYKVYIIDEAEKMTVQAQNALLKTIEEPPEYAVILFLTNTLDVLLQTVRSRCIIMNLRSVDTKMIQQYLMQKYQLPDYQARVCAAYAQGNVGKAIMMATSEHFREMQDFLLRLLKRVDDTGWYNNSVATFYFLPTTGEMVKSQIMIIDNVFYSFDANGYMTDQNASDSDLTFGSKIAAYATQFIGNPYVYGGTSLTNGADCSGFTQSVMSHFGIKIPRTADQQAIGYDGTTTKYATAKIISINNIQPGDLVFYYQPISHVGLYIGNGLIVHASTEAAYPVGGIKTSPFNFATIRAIVRYW